MQNIVHRVLRGAAIPDWEIAEDSAFAFRVYKEYKSIKHNAHRVTGPGLTRPVPRIAAHLGIWGEREEGGRRGRIDPTATHPHTQALASARRAHTVALLG